jgi:hypothetical protein
MNLAPFRKNAHTLTAPTPRDFRRIGRRRRIGLALFVVQMLPVLVFVVIAGLHAITAMVLVVLGLMIANQHALWFAPLGCPWCRELLHRSWLWSPFARVCAHCGATLPR